MADKNYTVPPVDIYETDDKYVLVADMPGVTKDDIEITLNDGVLTITGKVPERDKDWKPISEEFVLEDYRRQITVGNKIDESKITASYSNGVLMVDLAKSEHVKPRKIDVKIA